MVRGVSAVPNDPYSGYSASVPKLMVYQNRLYLYWSAIKLLARPPRTWLDINTRGMELVQQPGGERGLWGRSAIGPVASYDPRLNVQVWGVDPNDPRSNQRAEMFSAKVINNVIYATGVLGGNGCLTVGDKSAGCSRLAISVSTRPLGHDAFNEHLVPEKLLPSNPVAYVRIIKLPDGSPALIGWFANRQRTGERSLARGMHILPLPQNSAIRQSADDTLRAPGKAVAH